MLNSIGIKIIMPNKQSRNIINRLKNNYNIKNDFTLNLLSESYLFINKMESHAINFSVLEENKDHLILKINNFEVYAESVEDIFILSEVFIDKDYNFLSNEEYVFLDIGTNIGITSLFLSTKENIKAIYGFEPVPYTYKIAIGNLKRNNISNVEIKNIGLGGFSRKEEFVFNSKLKGNSGLRGEASFSIRNLKEKEKTIVSVDIIDVSEEFLKIKKIHTQEKIGLKIDCEGGEYEIIDKLDLDGLLDQVNVLIIEWHDKGAEHIEDILIKNKFKIFSRVLETNSGIIYASK